MIDSITDQNQDNLFRGSNLNKTLSPAEAVQKLTQSARDKAWSLYYWVRLLRTYGEEYGPEVDRVIRQIQHLQDQATEIERSQVEEAQ